MAAYTHCEHKRSHPCALDNASPRTDTQTNTDARKCASGRPHRTPRTPTAAPSEGTPNSQANSLLGAAAGVRMARTARRYKQLLEPHRCIDAGAAERER